MHCTPRYFHHANRQYLNKLNTNVLSILTIHRFGCPYSVITGVAFVHSSDLRSCRSLFHHRVGRPTKFPPFPFALDSAKLIKGDREMFSRFVVIELRCGTRVTCFSNFECTRKLLRVHGPTSYLITRRVTPGTCARARKVTNSWRQSGNRKWKRGRIKLCEL